MASDEAIAALRLLIAESDEATYTDVQLGARLDAAGGSENKVAWDVWTEKAAAFAALTDVSEGGSSRSQNQLMDKALKMADMFKARFASEGDPIEAPRVGTIVSKLRRR